MSKRVSLVGCLILTVLASCAHLSQSGSSHVVDAVVLSDGPADLTANPPAKYADAALLPLRQHWSDSMPEEGGVARIGATKAGLSVYTRFEDSDIFSTATADQQRMWTLGDVVEVFVKPGRDQDSYWEVHVTPNDFLMDLSIPSRAGMSSGEITWEEIIAPESGTVYQTNVEDGVWSAELTIPWSAFGLNGMPAKGTTWQFAVCRYNYNGGLENHVLSSTAPLTKASYHRYEEYTDLTF